MKAQTLRQMAQLGIVTQQQKDSHRHALQTVRTWRDTAAPVSESPLRNLILIYCASITAGSVSQNVVFHQWCRRLNILSILWSRMPSNRLRHGRTVWEGSLVRRSTEKNGAVPARPPAPVTAPVCVGWRPVTGCWETSFRFYFSPIPLPSDFSYKEVTQRILKSGGSNSMADEPSSGLSV